MGNYTNLCALTAYYFLGCENLSELARTCPWSTSVSELSRAIQDFNGNRFMRRLRASILKRYKDQPLNANDFVFAIDDTSNPKYSEKAYRCSRWKSSNGAYTGQKILVIVLVDIKREIAIPLHYIFASQKKDPEYKPLLEHAIDLFKEILNAGFPPLLVAADSWFDGVDFFSQLKSIGLEYAGEVKGKRLVKTNPGPNVRWQYLPKTFKDRQRVRLYTRLDSAKVKSRKKRAKCGAEAVIKIKNFRQPLKCVAVYNARNSKQAFAYYASTDVTLTGARLWEISRARWKIECLFRDLKQFLSFGKLPSSSKEAADLAVCIPFLIYTSLRLDKPTGLNLATLSLQR
jgi:SRSO17 transposase